MPQRRPLVDQVIAGLTELIEHEGLQVGDRLPSEPRLAARLGVARSTLREAIRALSHTGRLEARRGSGTYVSMPVDTEIDARLAGARVHEVFEVRRALEVLIAEVSPLRRTEAHVAQLRAALDDCREHAGSGDVPAFIDADSRFHKVAGEATCNAVLVELNGVLHRSLEPALVAVAGVVELHRATDRHQVLLDAIVDRDPAAAVAATRAHLDETVALYVASRTRQGP